MGSGLHSNLGTQIVAYFVSTCMFVSVNQNNNYNNKNNKQKFQIKKKKKSRIFNSLIAYLILINLSPDSHKSLGT